ncbi:unnamed protein product (macronuclear) [Paramecium tetraurelia]|uniref:Autophagy protein ATG5 UblB domain-containing protein n=1 Tax=Paramecium tetraurelia TaxID=5888 RepID=A0CZV4_PARTE|nr:uncharacterized protein GSPATT00011894001 [Paramecium tetraurelia]CAK76321.1 unnamed protein product [Paramecium tetraurelia]|eukprot:XP_001443718.1 hypothetical protein (macronuclear) [Paramecium tetraurelia strain d4-2]
MFQTYSDHNFNPQFYEYFHKIWCLSSLQKEYYLSNPIRIFIDGNMIQRSHVQKDVKEALLNVLYPILEEELNYNGLKVNVLGQIANMDFPIRLLVSTFFNPDGFFYIVIKRFLFLIIQIYKFQFRLILQILINCQKVQQNSKK